MSTVRQEGTSDHFRVISSSPELWFSASLISDHLGLQIVYPHEIVLSMKILTLFFSIFLCSCTTPLEQAKSVSRDFDFVVKQNANKIDHPAIVSVTESSTQEQENIPWLYETENWIKTFEKDHEDYRYFLYISEPIVSRSLCLDMAESKARAMILDAVPGNNGGKKSQGLVTGAQTLKSFWKTVRLKGAGNVYVATICSVLLKISLQDMMKIR